MTDYPQPPVPGYDGGQQGYGPKGPADDHLWAMLAYLLTIVAAILAPLVIYLVKLNESRYVRFHAAQSLNMGITAVIYSFGGIIVGVVLAIISHGLALLLLIPLFLIYAVAHLVYLILAGIAAYRGDLFEVPTVICLPIVH